MQRRAPYRAAAVARLEAALLCETGLWVAVRRRVDDAGRRCRRAAWKWDRVEVVRNSSLLAKPGSKTGSASALLRGTSFARFSVFTAARASRTDPPGTFVSPGQLLQNKKRNFSHHAPLRWHFEKRIASVVVGCCEEVVGAWQSW